MASISQTAHQIDALDRTDDIKLSTNAFIEFTNMMLSENVLKGLINAGFKRPSPIQLEAIPIGRCGFDLIVQAKSGTGKTCVFAVITLETVNVDINSIQALILAPTREIVVQISEVINSLSSAIPELKCYTFIGGTSVLKDKQNCRLCHIAVGTPGRIKQLIQDKVLSTKAIRLFILDEADKLLEESFRRDINWIYHKLPETKQMLALSATYPKELAQFLTNYMQDAHFVRLNAKNPALLGVSQYYKTTEPHPLPQKCFENKIPHIIEILSNIQFGQCLIFSNYQMRAQNLCDRLSAKGWPAACICGQMEQSQRLTVMDQIKKFQRRVLVSTDLTARGIDVYNMNLVINLDVPEDLETYLHRIGRAGRFGSHGLAITLAAEGEEEMFLNKIMKEGNLNICKLPDKISSVQIKQNIESDPATNSVVDINSCQQHLDQIKETNCDLHEQSGSGIEVDDGTVGAAFIENLKHQENLRNEKLGQQYKLEARKANDGNETQINREELIKATRQLFACDSTYVYDETTVSDDERDLQQFLNNVEINGNCEECETVSDIQEKEEIKIKSDLPVEGLRTVKGFLRTLHSTFFENLKQDMKPLLDLERDDELKTKLEEWIEATKIEEESTQAAEFSQKTVSDHHQQSKTTPIKAKTRYNRSNKRNKIKFLDEENEKEVVHKETYQQNDYVRECDGDKQCVGHNYYDFNQWYRSVKMNKYLLWHREYISSMLKHRYK